jgi:2,4-dienoyl-CoA reductase-like NADH-dependent reductase (Old Yellow Enzyme family)
METIPSTVIPKISDVPRASMIRRAVAVKVVRSAPPPATTPVCAAGIAFKNHAAKSGSAGSNPETGFIPNRERGNRLITEGLAALIAFGRPYISNPDLVERFAKNPPFNNDGTFIDGGRSGGYKDCSDRIPKRRYEPK